MADMLNVRIASIEKHALRILAAESNLNISEFVLKVLRDNTDLKTRAANLAASSPDMDQNAPEKIEALNASN